MVARRASGPRLIVAEPPVAYRARSPLVVDASVFAALLFGEPEADLAKAWTRGKQLFAPKLLDYEVANVAIKKIRLGLAAPSVGAALQNYEAADIHLLDPDSTALVGLANRYQLSAYDAAYLWIAAELKAPLATFDRRLGVAARKHLSTLS